jgi:hypothetical protein
MSPAFASFEEPEEISTMPEIPEEADPVLSDSAPLSCALPEDTIEIFPVLNTPFPDPRRRSPPVPSAESVSPALIDTAPPSPASPSPADTDIEPATPPTAEPVANSILPDTPSFDAPVANSMLPLLSALDVESETDPLLPEAPPLPLETAMSPPTKGDFPPEMFTAPPDPASLLPAATLTSPDDPPVASPEPKRTAPDTPSDAEPLAIETAPLSSVPEALVS